VSTLDTPGVDTLLARLLWERGAVKLEDLQQSLDSARRGQGTLARQLVARGLAAPGELERVLGDSLGVVSEPAQRVGPYLLGRRLGEGGMGVVWLGAHEATGVQVAVKTLPATSDAEFRDRFVREGEAQARVDEHPNVVRVHSAGNQDGVLYLVLDYAPGGDLADRLASRGALPPREAAEIARDLARGLAHVHSAGVLHRDLKPQNVLFGEDGRPRLVDFGLARLEGRTALTESGVMLGTPAYMAPEQATGERDAIGPLTDVYGLGALLYTVLTGHPPFAGATLIGILDQVLTRAPDPPGVDPALDSICLRCLEKDPADRFASASELAEALEAWLAGGAVASRPRRKIGLAGLGLFGLLAAAGLLGGAAYLATRDVAPAPIPTPRVDYVAKGVEAARVKRWRAALRHFESALRVEPSSLKVRGWRGIALRGLQREEEALEDLGAAYGAGLFPAEGTWLAQTWTARGAAHLAGGRVSEAEVAYERALEIRPRDSAARLGRGWVWVRQGRFAEARDLASEEIALNEGTSEPYLLRACARRRIRNELDVALRDHDRAVALGKNEARPLAERAVFYLVYLRRVRDGRGIADARAALEVSPRDPLGLALKAYSAVCSTEWAHADRILRLLEKDPPYQSAFAHWVRGLWRIEADSSLARREAVPLGQVHFAEAVRIDPWCPHANLDLGWTFRFLGNPRAAEVHLSRGLEVRPRSMSARRDRSVIRLELKDRVGALEDLEFLAEQPYAAGDLTHAGTQLRKLGYPARGLRLALRGLADTETTDGHTLRAECLIDLGEHEEAQRLISALPSSDQAKLGHRVELGLRWLESASERAAEALAARDRDPDLAMKKLREALRAAPTNPDWWKALAELELGYPELVSRSAYSATRGLEIDAERLDLLLLRARALAADGDARAARVDLDDLLARAPAGHALRPAAAELRAKLAGD
jgi:tetratricopeptide (TPR) repeat protein